MQRLRQNEDNEAVKYFEMGLVEGRFSGTAHFENDNACGRKTNNRTLDCVPENEEYVSLSDGAPRRETLYHDESVEENNEPLENEPEDTSKVNRNNITASGMCDATLGRLRKAWRRRFETSVNPNGEVLLPRTDEKEFSRIMPIQQEVARNKENMGNRITPARTQQSCCFVRFMAFILLVIFIMSATSLTMVIMIINGNMGGSEEAAKASAKDAAKPEKLTDLSSQFQEMQAQISTLNEELDNARQELKELKDKSDLAIEELRRELQHMRNSAQQGITVNNDTVQVNQSSENVDFELMLNTSQRRVMMVLTDMWASVNKTDKKLLEETRSLGAVANSTQREIQKVSNSLVKLTAKVRSEEKRLNDTIQLKERHSNDITSLEMLINSSRQDMMNKMSQMWSSVNSTEKDLQEHTTVSLLAVWGAINNTKIELQQKLNSISKMAGPIGPPGFNGSQGPAGPVGPAGAPGPKGAGDFSACQYKVVTDTLTRGSYEAEAILNEPKGSIVIGATCSTNFAEEYNLVSASVSNTRKYICKCKVTSKGGLFSPVGGESKTCYLHYWLCSKS